MTMMMMMMMMITIITAQFFNNHLPFTILELRFQFKGLNIIK